MKTRSAPSLSPEAKTELKQQRRNLLAKSHFGLTRPLRLTQGFSERGAAFINGVFQALPLHDWELAMLRTKISNAFHTYDMHDAAERRQSPSSRAHAQTVVETADPDSLAMDRARRVLAVAPQRGKPVNVPLDTLLVALALTWAREFKLDQIGRASCRERVCYAV